MCTRLRCTCIQVTLVFSSASKHKYPQHYKKCIEVWLIHGSQPTGDRVVNLQPEGLGDYCRHLHQLFIWCSRAVVWTNWHSNRAPLQKHFHLREGQQERLAAKWEIPLRFQTDLTSWAFLIFSHWSWSQVRKKKISFSHFTSHSWTPLLQVCREHVLCPESQGV